MEQYKKYSIIQVDGGAVMVDEKADIHKGDKHYDMGSVSNPETAIKDYIPAPYYKHKIIAHNGIESLKDSGLPLFEIPNESKNKALEYIRDKFNLGPEDEIWDEVLITIKNAYIEGYKAAGGYTEEDVRNAITKGYELARDSFYYGDGSIQPEIAKYINSLKKYPTSTLVGIQTRYIQQQYSEIDIEVVEPKVVNGYIQIKQFNYEQ